MYEKILLNGCWTLKSKEICVPATIPGYVHPALEKAGVLEDIFWRDNAEKCQWVEDEIWSFSRTFVVNESHSLTNAHLNIGGIDTYADILINGNLVAKSDNMFLPLSLPVGEFLKVGENSIEIVIYPYKDFVKDKPKKSAAFTWDRVYVRRIQCTFFWDWVNRFVSAGIWRDVSIDFLPPSRITDLFAQTQNLCKTSASLDIRLSTQNGVREENCFEVYITSPNGEKVWTTKGRIFDDTVYLQADLRNAQLWWPAGYGEQPLYTVTALLKKDDKIIDEKSLNLGIRTVHFEMLRDEVGSLQEAKTKKLRQEFKVQNENPGESFTLLVNGERIFCKGGNWVPCSPFPGTASREHLENLISLGAKAGMNTLRIWGGGIYETDDFYDLCDKYGIMLLHDFMFACGTYPDDDEDFVASFTREAEATVMRLRSHTCIACWVGNNENGDGNDWDDPNTPNISLVGKVFRPILNRLDPRRHFRPSSPYGGIGNTEPSSGDDHLGLWFRGAEKISPENFEFMGRFSTESALEGYPLTSTLKKFLTDDDIMDAQSPVIEYHIKNNIYFEPLGILSVHNRLKKTAEIILGSNAESRKAQLYNYAYIQYEWVRLSLEGMRKNKDYSSGILYWMYNDCWPALGYSLIDYYGIPKAGWYGIKQSGAPLCASIRKNDNSLEFILLNDSLLSGEVFYKVKLYTEKAGIREALKGKTAFEPNVNTTLADISLDELKIDKDTIVFLEVYQGEKLISRGRWYENWLGDVSLSKAQISTEIDVEKQTARIKCLKGVAIGVALDGDIICENNFVDLLEGEQTEIPFTYKSENKEITIVGYNI